MPCSVSKIIYTNLMSDVGMTHLKTFEYEKIIRIAKSIAIELGYRNIVVWKLGKGFSNLKTSIEFKKESDRNEGTLQEFGSGSKKFDYKTLIIFYDVHRIYHDEELLLSFQNIMEMIANGDLAINAIGLSPQGFIPNEIERYTQMEIISLPTRKEIYTLAEKHFLDYGVFLSRSFLMKFSETLMGLIEDEIPQLINKIIVTCFRDNLLIDEKILVIAQEQKKQIIQKSGILEFVEHSVGIDDVGGLYNLKRWLRERKEIFDDTQKALKYGITPPKGILLFGMPGSGKSLVAKVTANYFNLPLLRVDMGLIYGQKSPEEAIGRMIAMADTISPCVLWIDELEKALSGSESGASNDVSIKILGILLTWMQERTKPVFIIATANDISMIRPETYRDGRIDEKFMLGFLGSDEEQVAQIIDIHLRSRLKERTDDIVQIIDYSAIVKKMSQMVAKYAGSIDGEVSAGYTGANLEALVEKVLQDRFTRGKDYIETKDFIRMLNTVSPQHGIEIKKMLKRAEEMDAQKA